MNKLINVLVALLLPAVYAEQRAGQPSEIVLNQKSVRFQTQEQETTLNFPDFVDGGGWSVQLVLSNTSATIGDASVVVSVFDSEGEPVRRFFDSDSSFEIPSQGSRILRSAGVGEIRRGWIEVEADTASVSGLLTYSHAQSGVEVGVKPVELGNQFALFVEESSDIGTGLAIFKPESSPKVELRIRDEEGRDPLDGVFVPRGDFHQLARTMSEWFDVEGVDTGFLRDFRGLLFLRTEDGSLFAPLGLRFGKRTGSLSAVPVIRGGDVTGGMPPSGTGSAPPTVSLSASPTSIEQGQNTTLRWSSSNATSATVTPGIGTVPTSGSRQVSPTRTTTYRITVRGADGQTASDSTTVTVTEPPPSGLAPADQDAFNDVVVGKRVLSDDPNYYIDFISPGRFKETEGSDTYPGSYTYRNSSSNIGTVTLNYDDGDRCTFQLTFSSATSGTLTFSCNDGTSGSSNWRLADIPADGNGGGESGGTPTTRMEFESSTPSGYTAVTLSDTGRIWGVPTRYTNDSDPGTVAYMLLGKLKACDFANAEADRQSTVYIKTQSLGRLENFESETVCRRTSSRWAPSWPGVRMTHLLFFDESSPTSTREGVYNSATGKIELSESAAGGAQLMFSEGESATRRLWENTPPGINVGNPVVAVGADALTYTIGGTDAPSFVIVPETGQIRTREGITYDRETKRLYSVTVGVEDDEGNSDTIDVTILIWNLVPSCDPPSNFRLNYSDGRLTLRWRPLQDLAGQARVLGYETEIRRGTSGSWSDRRTFLGRNITGMIYADLTNGIGYQVRVRPINVEGDCGWSTPVSGIPTNDLAPDDPDRFKPPRPPVGPPDRNFRFLTEERCRHTSNGQTLDADCEYDKTGPDSGRIFLEFDDPSRGSCEITLAFSSLTAGSFIDECFGAGVNTNVPFDRSFRMPRMAPHSEDDLAPPIEETDIPRAPRTSEEFDALVFGRDDFIPGLAFSYFCYYCAGRGLAGPGLANLIEYNADENYVTETLGTYTYTNTGPSEGVLTWKANDTGETTVFNLEFEPTGNVRVTITDPNGNITTWPGMLYATLELGAQPILLPIPPSWSAAIAIETDVAPEDWNELESRIPTPLNPVIPTSPRDNLLGRTLFGGLSGVVYAGDFDDYRGGLNHSFGLDKLGHNRAIVTIEFWDYRDLYPDDYENFDEVQKEISGSTWVFDLTFTSDGAAKVTMTITKEGFLPTVIERFIDFAGDSINVGEFPDELLLPDDPPQASGEDRSGVEVAAAVSTNLINGYDVQTFLINHPGVQTAAYSPGDWLEPKDGSNQRMMIVGASQVSAARALGSSRLAPLQIDQEPLKMHAAVSPQSSPMFAEAIALLGQGVSQPVYSTSDAMITQVSVVCMQLDNDIPTRGARYFSRPKTAQDAVQQCQKDCVLDETYYIQRCVWRCDRGPEGN